MSLVFGSHFPASMAIKFVAIKRVPKTSAISRLKRDLDVVLEVVEPRPREIHWGMAMAQMDTLGIPGVDYL